MGSAATVPHLNTTQRHRLLFNDLGRLQSRPSRKEAYGFAFPCPLETIGNHQHIKDQIQTISINNLNKEFCISSIRNITKGKFLKKLILYSSLYAPLVSAVLSL